jgi:hypothetical protein
MRVATRGYRYTATTNLRCSQCSGLVRKQETVFVVFDGDECDDIFCSHCWFDPQTHSRLRRGVTDSCFRGISGSL